MSDATFNPYHQWLGLERSISRPNHYQLLGVDPSEQNAERIAQAANRALVKVRSCSPGSRNAEWTRLIEQITAAATCLCDPVRRGEYDRQLGVGSGRSFNRPAPRSRVAPATPAASGGARALPMHGPQGSAAARPAGPATGGGHADPMAPIVPVARAGAAPVQGQAVGYGTPQVPVASATPVRPGARGYPTAGTPLQATPTPGVLPGGRGPMPAAVPVAVVPTARAVTPVPVATSTLAGKPHSTIAKARRRKQSSSLMLLAVGTGGVMLLAAAVILGIVLSRAGDQRNRPGARPVVRAAPLDAERTPGTTAAREPTPPTRPAASGQKPAPELEPPADRAPPTDTQNDAAAAETGAPSAASSPPESENASPSAESPLQPEPSTPAAHAAGSEEPAEMGGSGSPPNAELTPPQFPPAPTLDPLNKTDAQPMSPDAQPPNDGEPKPAGPDVASNNANVTAEEVAALAKTLQTAHAAILDRNYDAAIEELDNIATLPKVPEHHARYERLMLLAGYAKNFQSALQSAIAGLHPGDQIEVGGSNVVGFVGATPGSITLRVTGTNRTYALEKLPVGLAVALTDRWLDKDDPVSLAVKGAYLASLRETSDERQARAREWLQEASQKGVEGELHKVLDDRYDLEFTPQQDVGAKQNR